MLTNPLNGDHHTDDETGLRSALTLFDELGELEPPISSSVAGDGATAKTPWERHHKRSVAADEESSDYSSSNGSGSKRKKQRKPAHMVFKEARDQLQEELRYLEAQAALLRHERGLMDPQVMGGKNALNSQLRAALLQHDLSISSVNSSFSGFLHSRARSPLETYIHLGVDQIQRRNALVAMKDKKVDVARRFLTERFRHVHPFKASCEVFRFESEEGDRCVMKMDVTPFTGASSVKEVLEAIYVHINNSGVSRSALSGGVPDGDNEQVMIDNSIKHLRSMTSQLSGVQVEKNLVVFYDQSKLNERSPDKQSAIITTDFVDRDDLHQYHPTERLRQDETSVIKLSAYWHHHRRQNDANREAGTASLAETELVVVLTHWSFVRLRRSELDVPGHILDEIASEMSGGIDKVVKSVKQVFDKEGLRVAPRN